MSYCLTHSVVLRLNKDHTKICIGDVGRNGVTTPCHPWFSQRIYWWTKGILIFSQDGSPVSDQVTLAKLWRCEQTIRTKCSISGGWETGRHQRKSPSDGAIWVPGAPLLPAGHRPAGHSRGRQAALPRATTLSGQRKTCVHESGGGRDLWL